MSDPTNLTDASLISRRKALLGLAQGAAVAAMAGLPSEAFSDGAVGPPTPASVAVTPFRVAVPRTAIADLKQRLRMTRFPEKETVADWSQGVPLAKSRALIAYWKDQYDWRRFEERINTFPQFRTEIDGLGIHFIHVRSRHPKALPIIMTHGWPGSVVEFLNVIGRLTDPTVHGGRAEDAQAHAVLLCFSAAKNILRVTKICIKTIVTVSAHKHAYAQLALFNAGTPVQTRTKYTVVTATYTGVITLVGIPFGDDVYNAR